MCGTTTAIVLTKDCPKRSLPPTQRRHCWQRTLNLERQSHITVARFIDGTDWAGSSMSMNLRPESQDRVFGHYGLNGDDVTAELTAVFGVLCSSTAIRSDAGSATGSSRCGPLQRCMKRESGIAGEQSCLGQPLFGCE